MPGIKPSITNKLKTDSHTRPPDKTALNVFILYHVCINANMEARPESNLLQKNKDLFERDYFFISLGRNPNFLIKAFEKELKLS
jgi:hypothetical protein